MSKILMDGFKIDASLDLILKTDKLLWYDSINNKLKVGAKNLNYYVDATTNEKVLTVLSQEESPGINILPVEFTVSTVTS